MKAGHHISFYIRDLSFHTENVYHSLLLYALFSAYFFMQSNRNRTFRFLLLLETYFFSRNVHLMFFLLIFFFSEKHHKSTRTWKHKFITGNEITRFFHVPLPLFIPHRSNCWLICCHYITFFFCFKTTNSGCFCGALKSNQSFAQIPSKLIFRIVKNIKCSMISNNFVFINYRQIE